MVRRSVRRARAMLRFVRSLGECVHIEAGVAAGAWSAILMIVIEIPRNADRRRKNHRHHLVQEGRTVKRSVFG